MIDFKKATLTLTLLLLSQLAFSAGKDTSEVPQGPASENEQGEKERDDLSQDALQDYFENITKGHTHLVELCFISPERNQYKTALSKNGDNALHVAVRAGSPEMLSLLLYHGLDPRLKHSLGSSPLILASLLNKEACLQRLLLTETHSQTDIDKILNNSKQRALFEAYQTEKKELCKACAEGNLQKMRTLLAKGFSLDITDPTGHSLIQIAAIHAQFDTFLELAKGGADLGQTSKNGSSLLDLLATSSGETQSCQSSGPMVKASGPFRYLDHSRKTAPPAAEDADSQAEPSKASQGDCVNFLLERMAPHLENIEDYCLAALVKAFEMRNTDFLIAIRDNGFHLYDVRKVLRMGRK